MRHVVFIFACHPFRRRILFLIFHVSGKHGLKTTFMTLALGGWGRLEHVNDVYTSRNTTSGFRRCVRDVQSFYYFFYNIAFLNLNYCPCSAVRIAAVFGFGESELTELVGFFADHWVITIQDGERASRDPGDRLACRGYLRLPLGGIW